MRNSFFFFYKTVQSTNKECIYTVVQVLFFGGIAFVDDFVFFLLTEYFAVHYLLAASLSFFWRINYNLPVKCFGYLMNVALRKTFWK